MITQRDAGTSIDILCAAGLSTGDVTAWANAEPRMRREFGRDSHAFSKYWRQCALLLAQLPRKPQRNSAERIAAEAIYQDARAARTRFMEMHAETLYASLTENRSRFMRLEALLAAASATVPGLVPGPDELNTESALPLHDKDGCEIDQGIFLSAILASEYSGNHLCHAMLLPRPEAAEHLPQLARTGAVDLQTASIERQGNAVVLTIKNPRYLNAEDETTIDAMEICVDLALLDPVSTVAVLRGGPIDHPKYNGRRVLGSGINLTHLYNGRIPYLWYLQRDLGFVHKIYRGLAHPDTLPDDVRGDTIEKPWIAAVEGYAIGGHCQYLPTMDYVIAERDAFITLPARKEGIIPGMANMRLPRLTGDRIARQAIQYGRRLDCDSPDGRLICDEIVDVGTMDSAIERVVQNLSNAGVVSATANRRAFRVAQEPLNLFRTYCAVYARDQARCHFSPALIANLEQHWNAQNRRP